MHIHASKTMVMLALNSSKQCEAIPFDGKPLKEVAKRKCLGSIFAAHDQGIDGVRNKGYLPCNTAFGRGMKYHCVQSAGFSRQGHVQFYSRVALHS